MKRMTTWIAPAILALATTPVLAADSSSGDQMGQSDSDMNSGQQTEQQRDQRSMSNEMQGDNRQSHSGSSNIGREESASGSQSRQTQTGRDSSSEGMQSNGSATSQSGGMKDQMKQKAADKAKREIDRKAGTGSGGSGQ
ncbi:hypothetical protein C7446_1822 [Kushneria sinocarnis]|uniref:Uncharacterized protein n=1 Tax=Kushneria sinocarnis TaxID=595502 RepID=A0A420WW09_9GAMM|nr:hypothetical protein [Kushneria sinocarnis]RKR03301.1 hypothetical protein C7446_1822 [Kushneria sinocarnis]